MKRSGGESVSVLVVEDERELAEVYTAYLEPAFDVQAVTNATEALERIDETVDVVLLDRQLPGMSGDEMLSELRERGYTVPVAMLTGLEPDLDIVEMPFDEYLTKPVNQDALVQTVRVLANRTSFEERSREFFRMAAKKASLETEPAGEHADADGYNELVGRMNELQAGLNDTIHGLLRDTQPVVSRSDPDQTEIDTLLTAVYDHTLPTDVRELVVEYQRLEDARPPFMWKWVHRLAPQNTLPCVDDRYRDDVPIDKTIAILFVTLLDDVLEKHQDRATFDEIAKLPAGRTVPDPDRDEVNSEYVTFAMRVWETLLERIQRGPNYGTFEELFRYDFEQAVDAIEYSDIAIRRPELATMSDLERFESHNMVMLAYADIDLMHSSLGIPDDFGLLRDAIWTAQVMARIGNWVSTWERELREGDYSSGPVVYALENGIVSHDELRQAADGDAELLDRVVDRINGHGVEKEFLTRWEQQYYQLQEYDRELASIDLQPFIEGTENVLRYHLASTGLK